MLKKHIIDSKGSSAAEAHCTHKAEVLGSKPSFPVVIFFLRKRMESFGNWSLLVEDLIICGIFARVHPKELGGIASVCKQWRQWVEKAKNNWELMYKFNWKYSQVNYENIESFPKVGNSGHRECTGNRWAFTKNT